MWRGILIAMLSSGFGYGAERFTTMHLNMDSVGTICGTNGEIAGTGFVVGSPGRIISCEHVVAPQKAALSFHFVNTSGAHIPLTLETVLPRYDLAVMRIEATNQLPSLPYGDIRRVRPGDDVVYIGWNSQDARLRISKAVVAAIGVVLNDGVSVDFIEFEGEGIPGYSGGPVLNYKGEVVALMREAWNKRGVRGGSEVLVNRGFAIEPAMLSREIYYPSIAPPNTNAIGTNTISIRLDPRP